MSTATTIRHSGEGRHYQSQSMTIGSLSTDMIMDILSTASTFQALQTLLQRSGHNAKVLHVFLKYKTQIYCAIAERQFNPLEGALEAAGMTTLLPPCEDFDPFDDPTIPLELLTDREGNNKPLEIRNSGPESLDERVQILLVNEKVVMELEKLFELRYGDAFKLSSRERTLFRTSLYRIWAFCNGVPRFGSRCVFDHDTVKQQYWETRFLWQYSAIEICEIGKVYAFLVGLIIECCRRCQHQEVYEEHSYNDEEYLSGKSNSHV